MTETRSPRVPPAAALALVAIAAGAAFVGPMTSKGWMLQIDWVTGPRPNIPRAVWGLDAGPVYGPYSVLVISLGRLLGHAVVGWLSYLLFFPVAALGVRRLVGGGAVRFGPAALLFAVNPFVFERMASGQIVFLLGYALLPWLAASLLRAAAMDAPLRHRLTPVVWIVAAATVLPHFAWLAAVLVFGVIVAWRAAPAVLRWALALALTAPLVGAHLIAPHLDQQTVRLDDGQLAGFATRGDPVVGLYGNVLALYGFFRPVVRLPKDVIGGWPFILAALLVVAAAGARSAWRAGGPSRRLIEAVGVGAGIGFWLALGTQGPFGSLYRWAAYELPGFAVMREPQKFAALLALAYAVAFGYGVEVLAARGSGTAPSLQALLATALVCLYVPNFFWGLGGQLRPSSYPAGWEAAERAMGDGQGRALFLPWHKFMRFDFSRGRIVEIPATAFFSREVISGDNLELPRVRTTSTSPRSRYIEDLLERRSAGCSTGRALVPLGVEYVVLAKAVDWHQYSWLDQQPDLQVVHESADLKLYRNSSFAGAGYRLPGVSAAPTSPCPQMVATQGGVSRESTIEYEVAPGPAGHVVVPEPFDSGWRISETAPVRTTGGVTAFPVGGADASVRYTPFRRVLAGYAVSAVALAGLAVARWVRRPGRRRGGPTATS